MTRRKNSLMFKVKIKWRFRDYVISIYIEWRFRDYVISIYIEWRFRVMLLVFIYLTQVMQAFS